MSNPGDADATPIEDKAALVAWLEAGCKPPEAWRIGTEHEKFGFRHADLMPPDYAPDGIEAMLQGLQQYGWAPIEDAGRLIGLKRGEASVSLEPAGQLELSGAPLADLHETKAELDNHLAEVGEVGRALGIGFAPLGFHPFATRAQMPWMPKGRYAIMRRYMPLVGQLGLDMMTRTCTVQVNLDFASEADMVRKLRTSMLLQPVATALFANSPFKEGKPNGYLSYRGHVWTDTDPDRTGMPAMFFENGFGFERYVDWLLDVPMYFIHRHGRYIDLAGQSFRRFMTDGLPDAPGEVATLGDFADHLTTVFPEVRLKRFLEMRGADAGTPEMMLAQSAFWVGLLYDEVALEAAHDVATRHDWRDHAALREAVALQGLATPWHGGPLWKMAHDLVTIATEGLGRRARYDVTGQDEAIYLAPLQEIVNGGPVQARYWLDRYQGAWNGDVMRIFKEAAVPSAW
jgi:glutamate--cysteine ligase